jgi:glycosyltransferase involved in cell wall biosynthesis
MLVDLASRPDASGADHAVALITPNPALRDMLVGAGLRVHDRGPARENPLAYLRTSLGERSVAWVTEVLREERARVAHLHTFQSHVVGTRAGLRAGVKIVRTEHDMQYFVDPSCSPFTRWSIRRVSAVVACSAQIGAYVARTAPYAADKITVVRNGVDAERFAPRPDRAPTAGPFRFVVACRLEPVKQVDAVIEAVALTPEVVLDVVGDGSERARLEELARARGLTGPGGRVRFHGYMDDPRDRIAEADAAVSGARREALGLSVLEALAMAKPVLAFAVGGIPEIVRDGETGWLVRDVAARALAEGMRRAAADRGAARALGEAGRRFVEDEGGVEAMCRGYAAVYAGLRCA